VSVLDDLIFLPLRLNLPQNHHTLWDFLEVEDHFTLRIDDPAVRKINPVTVLSSSKPTKNLGIAHDSSFLPLTFLTHAHVPNGIMADRSGFTPYLALYGVPSAKALVDAWFLIQMA
jgi:hypothetical protein